MEAMCNIIPLINKFIKWRWRLPFAPTFRDTQNSAIKRSIMTALLPSILHLRMNRPLLHKNHSLAPSPHTALLLCQGKRKETSASPLDCPTDSLHTIPITCTVAAEAQAGLSPNAKNTVKRNSWSIKYATKARFCMITRNFECAQVPLSKREFRTKLGLWDLPLISRQEKIMSWDRRMQAATILF